MKINNILTTIAGIAALGISAPSMALTPATTPDVVVNISGATALQAPLAAILTTFCNVTVNPLHTYYDDFGNNNTLDLASDGTRWRSYYCTFKTTGPASATQDPSIPASLSGKNVLFNNRLEGGSIWGVVPVARKWAVEYMNIFSGHCGNWDGRVSFESGNNWGCDVVDLPAIGVSDVDPGPLVDNECPAIAYVPGVSVYVTPTAGGPILAHAGTTSRDTVCLRSDGGVSDVEAAQFKGNNFPSTFPGSALSSSEVASMTTASPFAVIFGVTVSDTVYEALQAQQGLVVGCHENLAVAIPGCGVNSLADADTNRPSLPKSAVQAMFSTGSLDKWSELDATILPAAAFSGQCRRVVGSGSGAAANAWIEGDACLAPSNLAMRKTASGFGASVVGSQWVSMNEGSGDLDNCQNAMHNGTAFNGMPAIAGGVSSIGYQAISRRRAGSDRWDYIRIDGVLPNLANSMSGKYDFWFETTFQYPTVGTAGTVKDALDLVTAQASVPTRIKSIPLPGVFALPSGGYDWEAGFDSANPQHTHFPTGRGKRLADSCKPVQLELDNNASCPGVACAPAP